MYTLSIQPSFIDVIADVASGAVAQDNFWINFISPEDLDNGEAHEEIVTVSKETDQFLFTNENGLVFTKISGREYCLEFEGQSYCLRAPVSRINTGVINTTSFDISPTEDMYAIGLDSGALRFGSFSSDSEIPSVVAEVAHHSTIVETSFFPSGKVAITCGLDYQIKVWDVTNGTSPRDFSGHKSRITGLVMVDRGRNFVTSSLDGTLKLWDCGSGINVATLKRSQSVKDGITALYLTPGESSMKQPKSSFEFGTLGKDVFAGYESGVVTVFELGSRNEILSLSGLRSPVVSITGGNDPSIIHVAYENGVVAQWDIRSSSAPLVSADLGASINSMSMGKDEIVVSYGAGYVVALDSSTLETKAVLSGTEDDCKLVKHAGAHTYAAGSGTTVYKF